MSDAPLNGAGSSYVDPEWQPKAYRVTMADPDLGDFRFDVRVAAALGPNDAKRQAKERWPLCAVLMVREVAA